MSPSVASPSNNPLLKALHQAPPGSKSQRSSCGAWNSLPGQYVAAFLARQGFKWTLIDMEHGNISDDSMHIQVQTTAAAGCSPIVRVVGSQFWMIKRALDAGAHGVMCPMVETKEQAEAIVQACKYPPMGIRGAGSFYAPLAFGKASNMGTYINDANDDTLVVLQIESPLGLANVEEIASVDGVDVIFVGPADLSLSMGYPVMAFDSEPKVLNAIEKIRSTAAAHGKYTGIYTGDAASAMRREAEGFEMVTTGGDQICMVAALSKEIAAFNKGM